MCSPISNTLLERLFNQINIIKIKCAKSFDSLALNTLPWIKVSKVPSIFWIKIKFQGVFHTGSKKKAGEWCKENANATNVRSQNFQNDPILTFQPCRHPLHLKTLRVILTVELNILNFILWYFLFFDDLKYLFFSSYI